MGKKEKRNEKKIDRGIVDFMKIMNYFFKDLTRWIGELEDPRNQSYITYTQAALGYLVILINICSQHSMRQMEKNFNESACIDTLRILSGDENLEEMHCENRLSTTHKAEDGKTVKRYYHKVLEEKLVPSDKVVISLETEFIENENENVSKQDCELKAAKRLLKHLKGEYPRMPICIQFRETPFMQWSRC